MPKLPAKEAPETLRPYIAHGVDLQWKPTDKDAVANCPWCGREGKFSVKISTGIGQCFVCQEGSDKGGVNGTTFVRVLHDIAKKTTTDQEYDQFRKERKLASIASLKAWGVVKSPIDGTWMVPGFSVDGKLNNLYRYVPIKGKDGYKNRLILTPTLGQQLFGVCAWSPKTEVVDICEGPWDGMALWEMWKFTQLEDNNFYFSPGSNILETRSVVAVPGTKVFFPSWIDFLAGKIVNLFYDSDRPKLLENGKEVEPAGIEGMRRVGSLLMQAKNPPLEINYVNWGKDGFDPDLPDGHDVKDHLRGINA